MILLLKTLQRQHLRLSSDFSKKNRGKIRRKTGEKSEEKQGKNPKKNRGKNILYPCALSGMINSVCWL
jgi:hypothetical protein